PGAGDQSRQKKCPSRTPRSYVLGLAILSLSFAIGASIASADDDVPASPFELSPQDIERTLEDPSLRLDESDTNLQAAEELPHEDLGREDALELITSVFSSQLQEPVGIFDELAIQGFRADNVAVIVNPDSETALLDSNLPLRTENSDGSESAVDLDLERV